MRVIIVIMLFFCILTPSPTLAVPNEGTIPDLEMQGGDKGGFLENLLATLLDFPLAITKTLGESSLVGLKPIGELVFEGKVWSETEVRFLNAIYWAFMAACLPFFLVAIASTGFKLLVGGVSPGVRAEAIESIWRWLGALILVLFALPLVDFLLAVCNLLTSAIKTAFETVQSNLDLSASLGDWNSPVFRGDVEVRTGSVLGTAIVKVFFVAVWWWFNIIYLIRKFVLTAILCFTPLMALFWALNRNVPAFAVWLGELGSNALMPVAHALVLCVMLGIIDIKNVSGGWLHILVAVMLFVPLTEAIRNSIQGLLIRWAGVDESGTAAKTTAAVLGFGGLMSLGRLAGTMKGGSTSAPGGPNLTGEITPSPAPPGPLPTIVPVTSTGIHDSARTPIMIANKYFNVMGAGKEVGGFSSPSGAISPSEPPNGRDWAKQAGYKVLDRTVGTAAGSAGGLAGGVFRATLGTIPGMEGVGNAVGGAMGGLAAKGLRGTAGAAALGKKYYDAHQAGQVENVFGKGWEAVHTAGKALSDITQGQKPLSSIVQAPTLRNTPKYTAGSGGLGKII